MHSEPTLFDMFQRNNMLSLSGFILFRFYVFHLLNMHFWSELCYMLQFYELFNL